MQTTPKRFALQNYERYDLHSQLLDVACNIALSEGLISQSVFDRFHSLAQEPSYNETKKEALQPENLMEYAMQFRMAPLKHKKQWLKKLTDSSKFSPNEQEEIANLMSLVVPVLNAANSIMESRQINSNPKEIFTHYLEAGLKPVKGGLNVFCMTPEQWLEVAGDVKGDLILSLVNTAHPTNFYTPFGRQYERGLITALPTAIGTGRLSKDEEALAMEAFETQVRNACRDIKRGNTVTYTKKVTVGEETDTENDILKAQEKAISNVLAAWNESLSIVKDKTVDKGIKEKLELLRFDDEDKKRFYEQRSWIRAGADKDGREESTDVAFYAGYKDSLDKNGVYKGPILDLRDNAEVRKKLIGALVSRAYSKDENFRRVCDDFCAHPAEMPLGQNWRDANKSLFQHLSEKNQQAFLQHLMEHGINLFNRRTAREEALGFNRTFHEVYRELLKDHKLDKHTPYWGLNGNQRDELLLRMSQQTVDITVGRDPHHPQMRTGQYRINRVHGTDGAITGFNYNHTALGAPLTENRQTTNGAGSVRIMNDEESHACMTYLRRLFLVKDCIDEQGDQAVVAQREQAANFENASDFFAQLYLFQQAGLVKIKNNRVIDAKLGIQPLFETTPEMRRAPQIIDEILNSPLGESYYRARDKAEFMVGYSDGAKSGGNFASHYRIREFERAVTRKFKDKFGEHFQVRILRGPGRGENRGGTRKYDRQYLLHHDSVNSSGVNDQTVQGDLVVRMEMDPAFAQRTMAEMAVSTMAGTIESHRARSDLEIRRNESFEKAMAFIANKSEEYFRIGVFEKTAETDELIKSVPKNPNASSRRVKRSDTGQKGIGQQRAITVEYAAQVMGLPLHDYGLKKALQDFMESGMAVLNENGQEVRGEEALRVMAKDFAFFREEMKLVAQRQQDLNPIIAEHYANKAGNKKKQREFVADILQELDGLGTLAQSLVFGKKLKRTETLKREDFSGDPLMPALATVAQAVMAANENVNESVNQKLYLALQAPISEKPAGLMRSVIPGIDGVASPQTQR